MILFEKNDLSVRTLFLENILFIQSKKKILYLYLKKEWITFKKKGVGKSSFFKKILWVFSFRKDLNKKSHGFYGEMGVCIKRNLMGKLVLNRKDLKKKKKKLMGFIFL